MAKNRATGYSDYYKKTSATPESRADAAYGDDDEEAGRREKKPFVMPKSLKKIKSTSDPNADKVAAARQAALKNRLLRKRAGK